MDLIMSIILAVMIFFVQVSAGLSIFQSMLMASTLLPMCLLLHPKKYEYGQNILAGPCRNLIKEMDKFMDFYEEMIKREKASDIFLSIGDKEMEKDVGFLEYGIIMNELKSIGVIMLPWCWPAAIVILSLTRVLKHMKLNKWGIGFLSFLIIIAISLGAFWGDFNFNFFL